MPSVYTEVNRALSKAGFRVHWIKVFNEEEDLIDGNIYLERKQETLDPRDKFYYSNSYAVSDQGVYHKTQSSHIEIIHNQVTLEDASVLYLTAVCKKFRVVNNFKPMWREKTDQWIKTHFRLCKTCEKIT